MNQPWQNWGEKDRQTVSSVLYAAICTKEQKRWIARFAARGRKR